MSTSSNSTLQLPDWATAKARETVERYGPGDSEIKPRLVKIIAAALAEARDGDMTPGTPIYRLSRIAEYTEKEFGHEPYSAKAFEGTLFDGIKTLRGQIEQARAEGFDAGLEAAAEHVPTMLECTGRHDEIRGLIRMLKDRP